MFAEVQELTKHGLCAAGQANVIGVAAHFAPLDAANGTKLERLVIAVSAEFVGVRGKLSRIVGDGHLGSATRTAGIERENEVNLVPEAVRASSTKGTVPAFKSR